MGQVVEIFAHDGRFRRLEVVDEKGRHLTVKYDFFSVQLQVGKKYLVELSKQSTGLMLLSFEEVK